MALQSLQLRFCLDQFRFSQHLWRSEDTRRRPTGRLLYGNKFALRGSMGKSPRHIVRVARLIKANMTQRVTRVPEVYEHEAAFCHASPQQDRLSACQFSTPYDPLRALSFTMKQAGCSSTDHGSGKRRADMGPHFRSDLGL